MSVTLVLLYSPVSSDLACVYVDGKKHKPIISSDLGYLTAIINEFGNFSSCTLYNICDTYYNWATKHHPDYDGYPELLADFPAQFLLQ